MPTFLIPMSRGEWRIFKSAVITPFVNNRPRRNFFVSRGEEMGCDRFERQGPPVFSYTDRDWGEPI